MNWRWIDKRLLLLLHDESLAEHGGASGLRDEGLLDSALARPVHLAAYGSPDLPDLASAYAYGLIKNHPFVDGNKRAAFLAAGLCLALNKQRLAVSQGEATLAVYGLAASELSEADFARWIRDHSVPR